MKKYYIVYVGIVIMCVAQHMIAIVIHAQKKRKPVSHLLNRLKELINMNTLNFGESRETLNLKNPARGKISIKRGSHLKERVNRKN